jgi:hypothetical protein
MKSIANISEAIVQLSIIAAIFSNEFIPCSNFDETSKIHTHHDCSISDSYANRMDEIAQEEAKQLLSNTRWKGVDFINAELSNLDSSKSGSKHQFQGEASWNINCGANEK